MPVDDRYSRQILLKNIQEKGQDIFTNSHVVVIGCGALGTTIANNLVRNGIGHIKIVDRDIVELNNLQRQNLFDEDDIGFPKASAAAKKLKKINSEIEGEFEPNKDEIVSVINMAIDAEKKAQERYTKIAEMIKDNENKIIFQNLALDEKNHQRILEDEFYHLSNKGIIIWE